VADSVIGGAFLHPMGAKSKLAEASTRQTDLKFREYIVILLHFQIQKLAETAS
jgi:hypothetical protein